jgi:hypothetical protein
MEFNSGLDYGGKRTLVVGIEAHWTEDTHVVQPITVLIKGSWQRHPKAGLYRFNNIWGPSREFLLPL